MNSTPLSTEQTPYRPFAAFAFVWAVTTLVHQLAFTFWAESWPGWVLVFAAMAVIHRPTCALRFAIMVVASLTHWWEKMPFVPNHILYEAMLHLIILLPLIGFFTVGPGRKHLRNTAVDWAKNVPLLFIAIAAKMGYFLLPLQPPLTGILGALTTIFLLVALWRFLSTPAEIADGEEVFRRTAPVLRVAVLVMYMWAGTQKLNWDYFDPEVSCAALLHKGIAEYFHGLVPTAPWTMMAASVGSLVFEFGIPLLLFSKRTRYIGFVAALGFHMWLSMYAAAGVFSFSVLILGVLILFLPVEWGQRMQNLWDAQARWLGGGDMAKGKIRGHRIVIGVFFATLITQAAFFLGVGQNYDTFWIVNRIAFFVFFAWGLWIGSSYLIGGWKEKWACDPFANRTVPTIAWVGLIPILLNGVWPWIGGRTQTSFSMYSNLRSEGAGNHLFLKRVDLLGLQSDMVEVLTSKPDILAPPEKPRDIQQFANLGFRYMPWFEFHRLVSQREGDFEVTYSRNGKELSLDRKDGEIHGDPEAFTAIPLWQRKLIWFRRLETLDGPMCCTH